jgi:hypothetical protein
MQLQSMEWLQGHTGDRPTFDATISNTFFGSRNYHVFVMPQGLLLLHAHNKPGQADSGPSKAVVAGAVLGGALGACIGAAVASNASVAAQRETGFQLYSEEELYALARQRKKSFVAKADNIEWLSIDAPSGLSGMLADGKLAGWITFRESNIGKRTLEIYDQAAMSVAVDALPRRYGMRCSVNVELNRSTMKFGPRRS